MRSRLLKGAAAGGIAGIVAAGASVALAGSGVGGVFNLGVTNTVNAQTTLTGKTANPLLKVENTGDGRGLAAVAPAGAIYAKSVNGTALLAESTAFPALTGNSKGGTGVVGESTNSQGVYGTGDSGYAGLSGSNDAGGIGVSGIATGAGTGVLGRGINGPGVKGTSTTGHGVSGFSTSDAGVVGESDSSIGVLGQTQGSGNSGVAGQAENPGGGFGVFARGSTGAFGQGVNGGPAFYAEGDTTQNRNGGGFVKAWALINPGLQDRIQSCFSSNRPPGQQTTGDCGMSLVLQSGFWSVDFGFRVNDRFATLTALQSGGDVSAELFQCCSPNQWGIKTFYTSVAAGDHGRLAKYANAPFFIVVF